MCAHSELDTTGVGDAVGGGDLNSVFMIPRPPDSKHMPPSGSKAPEVDAATSVPQEGRPPARRNT
eukprot:scaffold55062_cov30-Tisochrysis_lutea.AAC.2